MRPVNANISYIPADARWPYVQTWSFGVQQDLGGNNLIDISYNGNHSSTLPIVSDFNQAFANLSIQKLGIQARRPLQNYHLGEPGRYRNIQCARREVPASLLFRPLLPEFFYLVEGARKFRATAGIRVWLLRGQSSKYTESCGRTWTIEFRY